MPTKWLNTIVPQSYYWFFQPHLGLEVDTLQSPSTDVYKRQVVLLNILVTFTGGFDMEKYLAKQTCADFVVSTTDYFRYSPVSYTHLISSEWFAHAADRQDDILLIFCHILTPFRKRGCQEVPTPSDLLLTRNLYHLTAEGEMYKMLHCLF